MTTKMTTKWTHKVFKQARNTRGEWFAFLPAATFDTIQTADEYARAFAREQGEHGVVGARIVVTSRQSGRVLAEYPSDAFIAKG